MRAPTTLGLAALLLLALGGLYLSHVSLAADPAHAPQGDLLARLRATEQRAAAAEKLAADAIAHAREMRLARDAAAAGRPIAPPAVASTHRDAPPAAQSVEAAIESWLAAPPSLPAPPAVPPKRTPGPLAIHEPPRAHAGGVSTQKKLAIAQGLGRAAPPKRETIADRVTYTPPVPKSVTHTVQKKAASPYDPIKPYPGSLDVCYDHEGESERVCISPEIQFRTRSKVHWIPADPSKPGWRFHLLVEDGFAKHPFIEPVLDANGADFVLYLPVSTRTPPSWIRDKKEQRQLIVLDEGDGAGYFPAVKQDDYLAYFKRSWVSKRDGAYTGHGRRYQRHYYPLAYSIADSYFDAHRRWAKWQEP